MGYNFERAQPRFGTLLLQTCLLSQSNQSIRRNTGEPHAVEVGEHGSSRHADLGETARLLLRYIGDATEVIRLFPSGLASR